MKKITVVPAKADAGMKYGSPNSVRRMFDLLLYELESQGLIESLAIRQPGKLRGTRLWHIASIEKYLEAERIKRKREAGVVMEMVDERQAKKAAVAK